MGLQPPLHGVAASRARGRDARAECDVEEPYGEEHAAAEHLRPLLHVEGEEARREVDAAAAGGGAEQRAVPLEGEGEVVAQQRRLDLEHAREAREQRDVEVEHQLQGVDGHQLVEDT